MPFKVYYIIHFLSLMIDIELNFKNVDKINLSVLVNQILLEGLIPLTFTLVGILFLKITIISDDNRI